ncbi:Reverse transcriptase domain [Lasallia pustulata]|uniref:Reverse transcriptase domain n=1 Tax=Lasallia pustulata TaxID=136370 RepID=A0A1W5CVC0_9LECA|nr:Reverse transcriptase domain [Lasallia pustulata]
MPFGLTNAPATFQAFIDKAFGEFLDITCVVYLDNILIFSKDESDHEEHVQQVLAALRCYDIHLKISKCSFNTMEVDFLGFRINTEGIFMDPERVFPGFGNFFQRFIKNYLQIAAPLLNLLKMGKNKKEIGVKVQQTNVVPPPFPLSKTALEAFKTLKEAFTSAPLLRYFDKNKPMRVETDASAFAIGRILTQQFEIDGHLHWLPVTYYSKKLLDTETQYGTEGKKNPANSLSRRPDYKLPKASTTLTAAETVRQSFCLGSNDYKPVQEKLYTLAVMTLRSRRPVRQVRQEDGVPDTNMDVGIEGGGAATAEESSVQCLPA